MAKPNMKIWLIRVWMTKQHCALAEEQKIVAVRSGSMSWYLQVKR